MQLKKGKHIIINSNESKFLVHCIQMIGVWAKMASSIEKPFKQTEEIESCFVLLRTQIANLVYCKKLQQLSGKLDCS